MASISLAALQPAISHSFEDPINYTIRRVGRIVGEAYLRTCQFEDEHCNCRARAAVHHLESEQDLCLRHFQAVNRG